MNFISGIFGAPAAAATPAVAASPADAAGSAAARRVSFTGSAGGDSPNATYQVGEMVEYNSSSGDWIPAKVLKLNMDGTIDLDCKKQVSSSKVRKRNSGTAAFKEGDMVNTTALRPKTGYLRR
jgi:hypothetical protein